MKYNESEVDEKIAGRLNDAIYTTISYIQYLNAGSNHIDKVQIHVILDDLKYLKENLPILNEDTKKYMDEIFGIKYGFRGYRNIPGDLMVGKGSVAILFDTRLGPVYWVNKTEDIVKIAEDELVKLAFYSVTDEKHVNGNLRGWLGPRAMLEGRFRTHDIEHMIEYFPEPERKESLKYVLDKVRERDERRSNRNEKFY